MGASCFVKDVCDVAVVVVVAFVIVLLTVVLVF